MSVMASARSVTAARVVLRTCRPGPGMAPVSRALRRLLLIWTSPVRGPRDLGGERCVDRRRPIAPRAGSRVPLPGNRNVTATPLFD